MPLLYLPDEILSDILEYLPQIDLADAMLVNKKMCNLSIKIINSFDVSGNVNFINACKTGRILSLNRNYKDSGGGWGWGLLQEGFYNLCRYNNYRLIKMIEGYWRYLKKLLFIEGVYSDCITHEIIPCREYDLEMEKINKIPRIKTMWGKGIKGYENHGLKGTCNFDFGSDEYNNVKIIALMIKRGANEWNAGLSFACDSGNLKAIKIMINFGAKSFNAALFDICLLQKRSPNTFDEITINRYLEIARLLISLNAVPFPSTIINICRLYPNESEICEYHKRIIKLLDDTNTLKSIDCVCGGKRHV